MKQETKEIAIGIIALAVGLMFLAACVVKDASVNFKRWRRGSG